MAPTTETSLERLESFGFLTRIDGRLRTTRRWQGAMARAAKRLLEASDRGEDLRVPIAVALVESHGADLSDDELAELVDSMLPIEREELQPTVSPTPR